MKAEWILRIGVFGTFLGHGLFALSARRGWVPFLTVVGFSEAAALKIMPIIGAIDILVALLALFKPMRIVLLYASLWAFATAVIRPVAGLHLLDFVERAANWAAPLALLLLRGFPKSLKQLFE